MATADQERPIRRLGAVGKLCQWAGVSRAHDGDLSCGARWYSHTSLCVAPSSLLSLALSRALSGTQLNNLVLLYSCVFPPQL